MLLTVETSRQATISIRFPAVRLMTFGTAAFFTSDARVRNAKRRITYAGHRFAQIRQFNSMIVYASFRTRGFVSFIIATDRRRRHGVHLLTRFAHWRGAILAQRVSVRSRRISIVFERSLVRFHTVYHFRGVVTFHFRGAFRHITYCRLIFGSGGIQNLRIYCLGYRLGQGEGCGDP